MEWRGSQAGSGIGFFYSGLLVIRSSECYCSVFFFFISSLFGNFRSSAFIYCEATGRKSATPPHSQPNPTATAKQATPSVHNAMSAQYIARLPLFARGSSLKLSLHFNPQFSNLQGKTDQIFSSRLLQVFTISLSIPSFL